MTSAVDVYHVIFLAFLEFVTLRFKRRIYLSDFTSESVIRRPNLQIHYIRKMIWFFFGIDFCCEDTDLSCSFLTISYKMDVSTKIKHFKLQNSRPYSIQLINIHEKIWGHTFPLGFPCNIYKMEAQTKIKYFYPPPPPPPPPPALQSLKLLSGFFYPCPRPPPHRPTPRSASTR